MVRHISSSVQLDSDTNSESSEGLAGISIVVPVYNSASTLGALVDRIGSAMRATGRRFEAVFVNDGSADSSWAEIEKLSRENPWLRGIDLMRNSGQENALLCGVRAARMELIATIDDDLQNPPEEIGKMAAKLEEEGLDVVYGTPQQEQHGVWRDSASVMTKFMMRHLLGVKHARDVTAFKVFRTSLRDAFTEYRNPYVSIDLLLTWGTDRFGALVVRHDERAVGRSQFTLRKLVRHAITMITGFSVVPLRLASLIGFAFALMGFVVLMYVLVEFLVKGSPVAGFPFLASIISIFSGAQLLALVPRSVADFYGEVMNCLKSIDCEVKIWPMPVEISKPIPFPEDTQHAAYDPQYVTRFWQILSRTARLFQEFRAGFIGKCSPVHFFWGSFDLAVTRFSGRRAPQRPGADRITREAYSHECISHGFWPGGEWFGTEIPSPLFYSYTAPEPQGLRDARIRPSEARFDTKLGEFVLPYDALRTSPAPDAALMDFLQTTYEAGADRAGWNRQDLERATS